MSISGGPYVSDNGLIFYMDVSNPRSYVGEPTANLIGTWSPANETRNAYPSDGNAWGTYHVEVYNAGAYLPITGSSGAPPVVTNNVVTCSIGHLFRTYTVIRPATTGGGVSTGTNYFVKKMDSASFTLHTYSATENVGFNAHAGLSTPLTLDTVNFPTLWISPAHVPNSTHVKEIVSGGFNGHNCMRVHHFRLGDIQSSSGSTTHGVAYGVTPTLTAGNTYTFSFYYKAASSNMVGRNINWQRYTSPTDNYSGANLTAQPYWQRYTHTMTAISTGTTNQYWLLGPDAAVTSDCTFDLAEIQIEQLNHATKFTPYNRSLSSSLYDISGFNNTPTASLSASNMPYSSSGDVYFDGTSDYIQLPNLGTLTDFSICFWEKAMGDSLTGSVGYNTIIGTSISNRLLHQVGTSYMLAQMGAGNHFSSATAAPRGQWNYICYTYNSTTTTAQWFANGIPDTTLVGAISFTQPAKIGSYNGTDYQMNGKIDIMQIYNRVLTNSEIMQNFNSTRSRFGI